MNHFTKCCVKTCINKASSTDDVVRFHRLPVNNRQLLQAWIKAIDFDETLVPAYYSAVCSVHFRNDDYVIENGIAELSPTAVPSNFIRESVFIKEELYESANAADRNNEMDNSNLIITGYQSMIGEEEQHNLSGSPVIMSVCGSFQETFPNLELNIDNLNCNQEPLYNDGLNNEYQYKSSYGQLFTKTNGNNNAPISSCIIPIDAVNRLISSSSQHTFNSKQLDISNENEIYPGSLWILNNPRQAKYKEHLPAKFHKKLEYLAQENRRLFAKCKTLMTSKRILLDTETKYLQLKNKVLETEEILLEKGLNTSELSVFRLAKDTIEIPKDVEHQVLLECKLAEVNNQLYNNSASQSTRLFTEIEPPTDNGNSMSEIHNLVTK